MRQMFTSEEDNNSKYGSAVVTADSTEDSSERDGKKLTSRSERCGYGPCHPEWLQVFLKPKMLVGTLCCFAFIQSYVVNGLNNANTVTYEKRFFLKSSEVGIISSSYDFAAGILVIPISYFGAHVHKARMLGITAAIFGLGSFVMLLPHIITDTYDYGQEAINICNKDNGTDFCANSKDASLPVFLYVLCFGMVLHGVGGTTLYTVGTSAIDECITRQASGFVIGILYCMGSLGPALGFILGGEFLKIYVDFDVIDESSIPFGDDDPRWVGSWWIGFIISASLIIIVAVVLFGFPSIIPVSEEVLRSRIDQSQEGLTDEVSRPGFGSNIRDLPRATLNLLKNWPFLFISLAGVSDGFITSGFGTFTAKFIEQQFNQSTSFSNILFGAIVIPGAAGGQFLGGYICKRANLKVRGMLRWTIACSLITVLLSGAFWFHCDDPPIAGVNRAYRNGDTVLTSADPIASCNSACKCVDRVHEPVCGDDHLEYLTPCHAGCLNKTSIEKQQIFLNCSCVGAGRDMSDSARSGRCGETCTSFYITLPFMFAVIFTLFLVGAPLTALTLRCVPDAQRTYSLGVQWVFIRFLGTVPGPIVFGLVLDSACKLPMSSCDGAQICWIYDRFKLSRNMFLLAFSLKILTSLFYSLALCLYKPPRSAGSFIELAEDNIDGESVEDYRLQEETGTKTYESNPSGVENKAFVGEPKSDKD